VRPDSRNLFRSHEKDCPHRNEGRTYKKCRCPIWLDHSYAGKRIYRSLGTRNWQEAEDVLREWETEDLRCKNASRLSRLPDPSSPTAKPADQTLEAACAGFLADAEARRLSDPSLYKYRLLLRRLQAFALERGLRFLAEFGLQILREFWASLPNRNTPSRKRIEELRTFFSFCQDAGWIPGNPAKKLKAPVDLSPPREPFTDEEVERIRAACPNRGRTQRLRTLVEVMLHTGFRIGDAVTLRRDRIVHGKVRLRTQKTGTEVCCPLPRTLITELENVRGTSQGHFFWTGKSKPKSAIGNWQRALKRLFELAGVPGGHAHRFRHTFAKNLLMAGVPVERVAVLMGHRSQEITSKHYSAWVRERQEQLEEDVRRVWAEKTPPIAAEQSRKRPERAIQPLYKKRTDWIN
jgi:integrase/recombinase XerD